MDLSPQYRRFRQWVLSAHLDPQVQYHQLVQTVQRGLVVHLVLILLADQLDRLVQLGPLVLMVQMAQKVLMGQLVPEHPSLHQTQLVHLALQVQYLQYHQFLLLDLLDLVDQFVH